MSAKFVKILLLIVAAGLFGQCQNPFAPAVAGDELQGTLLLTEQKTPDQVLQNFQYAYTFKDSLVYSEILDTAFIFIRRRQSYGDATRN